MALSSIDDDGGDQQTDGLSRAEKSISHLAMASVLKLRAHQSHQGVQTYDEELVRRDDTAAVLFRRSLGLEIRRERKSVNRERG